MLSCKLLPDGKYRYTLSTFERENKVIWWNRKRCHFKEGDFYRVKNANGFTSEVEITKIHDNGMVETVEYSAFRWHSRTKMHKKGKMTHSVTLGSFYAEDMYADIQGRGKTFHKIKKLSPKYLRIKRCWDIKWKLEELE